MNARIVTIGLAPAWDVTCRGRDLDWGRHAELDCQVSRPAGKALNVSYALAWMGLRSVATGLWGRDDYDPMQRALDRLGGLIDARMTIVEGRTRHNITVVDSLNQREMHLRQRSSTRIWACSFKRAICACFPARCPPERRWSMRWAWCGPVIGGGGASWSIVMGPLSGA